jgi:hypothetical protein
LIQLRDRRVVEQSLRGPECVARRSMWRWQVSLHREILAYDVSDARHEIPQLGGVPNGQVG